MENPHDRARCHPIAESFQRPLIVDLQPLVAMHPDNPSWGANNEEAMEMEEDDKEEDNLRVEGEEEVGLTCHT